MFSNSVTEPNFLQNTFDDEGLLCNSPTPIAASTAKKKLNALPCTSYTQEAANKTKAAVDHQLQVDTSKMSLADNALKYPGMYLPSGTWIGQAVVKRQSEILPKQKPEENVNNLLPGEINKVGKLDTSVSSERSTTSSMGLLPEDIVNNEFGTTLSRESCYFPKSLNLSHSADLSEIEQVRRCPAEDPYKSGVLSTSHFANAHAFLQSQGMKFGMDSSCGQSRIVFEEKELLELNKEFEPEKEDTMTLEDDKESRSSVSDLTTPVKIALNDVGTNAGKLISMHGKHLEEMSYCSALEVSSCTNQSFSLEKMLNEKSKTEKKFVQTGTSHDDDNGMCSNLKESFSCDQYSGERQGETSKLYDDDPFHTELAYRTEFDADFGNFQNDGLGDEFEQFESAAARLDADEASFFRENANPNYDEVLQVPLAQDVADWSYRSHISFSTPTNNHERMSLGTYMNAWSNQSMFNNNHAEAAEFPILEELVEEEDLTEDLTVENPDDREDTLSGFCYPPSTLAKSIISNSIISDVLDVASMSMSNNEIAKRLVAQLDKCQKSRSESLKDMPWLENKNLTQTLNTNQFVTSQTDLQPKKESSNNFSSFTSGMRQDLSRATSSSTHTLTDQSACRLEELRDSMKTGVQNQFHCSPVATTSNQLPFDEMKFCIPRESMPRNLKFKDIPESKLNCHLKFDDTETMEPVIGKDILSRKSPNVICTEENGLHGQQNMSPISLKSAQGETCPSGFQSHVNDKTDKGTKEGTDLLAVLSTRMNVTDACKIQTLLMNQNHTRDDIDKSYPWQTMMEEPLGQTQLNFDVFTSTLLEDANHSVAATEDLLALVDGDTIKQKPKFEIDRMITIPDTAIGISETAHVSVRSMVQHLLECNVELVCLFVNDRKVAVTNYSPFYMKEKFILMPMESKALEVIFCPKDPGSYTAKVRVSSGSQAVSPRHKSHDSDHVAYYVQLNGYADIPSIHFSPKELDFGQQSWGSTGCLPITVANKSHARVPLRLVIYSKSSNSVFRWGHQALPHGSESKYTVVNNNICSLTLPRDQAGCVSDMITLDIICDLVKNCALKDSNKATSLLGYIELQLDVPTDQPPLGVIQLMVTAGTTKLHVSNGSDLIVMETSINKPAIHTLSLRNAGTLNLHVALDLSHRELGFTLDSDYLEIPVGENADMNISFNPHDDTVSSHNIEMTMFIEPSGPVFAIPIQGKVIVNQRMHPRQQRWLLADMSRINFGGVQLAQPKEITLRLKNTSQLPSKIELVICSEAKVFKFSTLLSLVTRLSDSKSVVVQPNEVYPVTIVFNPTRASVFKGKVNIKSCDDSRRFVVPLLGYGGLSEMFLIEPRNGILNIIPNDMTADSSQTSSFTLKNTGVRDAFFCVQIYEDSEKSVLANSQAITIHPRNGILKSLDKIKLTLLYHPTTLLSLPAYITICNGDEEARQQMKRALKKFPNQRTQWKRSEWFDTVFTNEDDTQSSDLTSSQKGDIDVFFNQLTTLELTVGLGKKPHDNLWSHKNQKPDMNSNLKADSTPTKETRPADAKLKKDFPDGKINKENIPNINLPVDKASEKYSQTQENSCPPMMRMWKLMPEQLTFVSKDPQIFSIINFTEKPLNFQLSWATDKMSVSHSTLTIKPHEVSTKISVSPCSNDLWEGFIYVKADSLMQDCIQRQKDEGTTYAVDIVILGLTADEVQSALEGIHTTAATVDLCINAAKFKAMSSLVPLGLRSVDLEYVETFVYLGATVMMSEQDAAKKLAVRCQGHLNSHTRQPLQAKLENGNHLSSPTILRKPNTTNSDSDQRFHSHQLGHNPHVHSSHSQSNLPPTSLHPPSVLGCDSIEHSPVDHSQEKVLSVAAPESPLCSLERNLNQDAIDVQMTSEVIQFYLESGCELVHNYLEFTNFGKTSINWILNNERFFPYVSTDDGKRTVMKSYEIFKIFRKRGMLAAGQTQQVHILFYPKMLYDKKFLYHQSCELICQQDDDAFSQKEEPIVIPFHLQGCLTSDRCSLTSFMSTTSSSMLSIASSVASSAGSNPDIASSSCSEDQKLILKPNVVTFQPCPLGKLQQFKVSIKNRNSEPVKMTVEGLHEDVFSLSVKSFTINPKKLVKIPIAFKPVMKGFANGLIIFRSGKTHLHLNID